MSPEYLIPLSVLAVPAVFISITSLLGLLGGWSRLGRFRAEAPQQPPLKRQYLVSGKVGWVNYNSVISLSLYPDALYLTVMPLFRIGHPCLLIPRDQMKHAGTGKTWYGLTTFSFQVDNVKFTLLGSAAAQQLEQWIRQPEA